MPQFNADILGRLAEASAAELTQAVAAIRDDYNAIKGQSTVTEESRNAVVSLRDALQALTGEQTRRAALASDHNDALSELDSQFADLDKATETPATEPEPTTPPVTEPATEPATEPQNEPEPTSDGDNDPEGQGDSVTASARRPLGGTHRPAQAPARQLATVQHRTTAAAGLAQYSPGQQLTRPELWDAFADKIRAASGAGRNGYERYTVATVRSEYPEARRLAHGASADANMALVEAVVDAARGTHARDNGYTEAGQALTAAGLCAPLEVLYDIRTIGDTERPVRDALVRFGVDRGGITYRPALDGVTQTGGIGIWDEDDDEADPLVPKSCVEIDCPGIINAQVEAIYQCLTFSNMSTRFDPEYMDSVVRAQAIAHARFAENRLLTTLTTASKDVYATATAPEANLGAIRRILPTLDKVIAYYRNVHRLANETSLRLIVPLWVRYLMRADMTMQMVGDGVQALAVTDAAIDGWFRERNVNPTYHLDGIDPADITTPDPDIVVPAQFYTSLADGSPVPAFPTAISSLLFAEGDWLFLDGGTLDLGVVRDSTLNGQNRFQTFSESFEFAANRGIESLHLVIPAVPTGASAATADTTP